MYKHNIQWNIKIIKELIISPSYLYTLDHSNSSGVIFWSQLPNIFSVFLFQPPRRARRHLSIKDKKNADPNCTFIVEVPLYKRFLS